MRSMFLVLTAAAALIVAGCGGSTANAGHTAPATNQATTPPGGATATSTATSSPATTATSTQTSVATPTTSTPSICRATELSASFLGGQAATGHGLLGFALRNTSSHTCVAFGYPGVQFLTRSGQPLPTVPTHTTEDFFGTLSSHPFALAAGATASFRLGVTHGAASTAGCDTAYALQIIPPNDTATLHVAIANGAYECRTTTVSPLQPGTSAYP